MKFKSILFLFLLGWIFFSLAKANETIQANHITSLIISDPVAYEKTFKNASVVCGGLKIPEGENYAYSVVDDYYANGLMVSYVKSYFWIFKFPDCVAFKEISEDKAFVYKNRGECRVDLKKSKVEGHCEIKNPYKEFTKTPIRQETVKGFSCDVYLWENPPAFQSSTLMFYESCETKPMAGMDLPRTYGIPQHMRLSGKSWYVKDGVTKVLYTQEVQQISMGVMVPRSLLEPHKAPGMDVKGN